MNWSAALGTLALCSWLAVVARCVLYVASPAYGWPRPSDHLGHVCRRDCPFGRVLRAGAMTPSRETKAGDWIKARAEGRRLPEHIICDWCGGPADADDFNPTAGCVICPACLETMVESRCDEVSSSGLACGA